MQMCAFMCDALFIHPLNSTKAPPLNQDLRRLVRTHLHCALDFIHSNVLVGVRAPLRLSLPPRAFALVGVKTWPLMHLFTQPSRQNNGPLSLRAPVRHPWHQQHSAHKDHLCTPEGGCRRADWIRSVGEAGGQRRRWWRRGEEAMLSQAGQGGNTRTVWSCGLKKAGRKHERRAAEGGEPRCVGLRIPERLFFSRSGALSLWAH